jgi:hypothetical protein
VYNTGATPPSYAASPILVTIDGTANVEVEFTASGGTRTLQNVQLEAGNVASAFEYRPISTELSLCQRYYALITQKILGAILANTAFTRSCGTFPSVMRIAPTYVSGSLSSASINSRNGTYTPLYDTSGTTPTTYEIGLYVSGSPSLGNAWDSFRLSHTTAWNAEL